MQRVLRRAPGDSHEVTAMILGHNIEMCLGTADGLLSDRLRNPKFLGPAHAMTHIAPHWLGTDYGRAAYELTPFGGLAGSEAQLVRVNKGGCGAHLVQNGVQVRSGEDLELEIWARAWHRPVTVRAMLLPLEAHSAEYDSGDVVIDKPHFHRYTIPLTANRDDDEARLQLQLVGDGEVWFDQIHLRSKAEPHLSRSVMDTISAMRIPTLRFPGGIIVNAYHWKHGTGPVHLRPAALDAAFHHDWYLNYDFGLDEYLRLCADQGIVPAITLNPATETPDDARELAAYCAGWFAGRDIAPPLIYWHVGNHPYLGTTAGMTPDMYAGVIRDVVPGVKEMYANSRIVAVMSEGDLAAKPEAAPWREALFGSVADLIDVVEVQKYGGVDPLMPPEEQVDRLADALSNVEPRFKSFISLCRSRGVVWKVGVAEWNWWMRASHWDGRQFHEPPTVLHGLFIAGMIRRFAALMPDLEIAHFYNLVNCMGIINRRGATVEITDPVRLFNLYRPALPGRFVPMGLSGEPHGEKPYVEALGLENGGGLYLFLTNRSTTEYAQVSLGDLSSAKAIGSCFRGESPGGVFSQTELEVTGDAVVLPPLSITRVLYEQ